MKYETALKLRSFIDALASESHDHDICCAIKIRIEELGEWECHVFHKGGFWEAKQLITVLAAAITLLCPVLTTYQSRYDFGTRKGEDVADSIVIW